MRQTGIQLHKIILSIVRFSLPLLVVFTFPGISFGDGQYQINWFTIDCGGGTSSGGVYTLTGTIGQLDAQTSSSSELILTGGFWPGLIYSEEPVYTGAYYDQWLAVGSPPCWCANVNPRQCHGDVDGTYQGNQKYWVSTNDLDILITAWNKPFGSLSGNQICADLDHLPQGREKYRVSTNDLDILIANWNLANGPAPDCP